MADARKVAKGAKGGHRPPEGRVRLSQAVMTFGPGAMVDLLDHAVLIGGLDYWRYDKYKDQGFVDEPRLRDAIAKRIEPLGVELSLNRAFRLPPAGDDDAPSPYNGIQVIEFPTWFVCQRQQCRALAQSKNLEKEKGRYVHRCTNTQKGVCVPVRFVATCKKGHLEEFPWVWFVHAKSEGRCEGTPDLYLEEDASGDFSHIVVECRACGLRRRLSEAREPKILPQCRGDRPWLGPEGREEKGCQEHVNLLVRTASCAYFSQWINALSIPDKSREVVNRVSQADVWSTLQEAEKGDLAFFRKKIPAVRAALQGLDDDDVFAAIEAIRRGRTPVRDPLRTAEYKVLLEAKDEVQGQIPPKDKVFFACRLPPQRYPLPAKVARVVLVKKLRQVRAQIGLTRLSATPSNLQGDYEDASRLQPLALSTNWLPAAEIFGEGVLVCLDEGYVQEWEGRQSVRDHEQKLADGFELEFRDPKTRPAFPGARFYLLHSLSHLLMSSISLQCGYSAAALGERIYCAPATDDTPMATMLVMTGTSGAEGTLGGLVEQGRHIGRHLRRAWEMGTLCSNDPVCAHHGPTDHSARYLEGAACHGCLFVAEPACERHNRYLDRSLVVPTLGHPPDLAFFSEPP
jgi:hypothetical protein